MDLRRLNMEDLLRRTLCKQIELESALAADLWTTLTDANQLESSLLNIAINARDVMTDGGWPAMQFSDQAAGLISW